MTVALETVERLHQLNHEFLGIDQPTDVLSFPSDEMDPDTNLRYLGDVIISYEQAGKQAEAAGESIEDELQLLVIHGVLHLLGHDHSEPDEKARMWAAQKEILALLGCRITTFPE
jgi:probable rRNA maturation factor